MTRIPLPPSPTERREPPSQCSEEKRCRGAERRIGAFGSPDAVRGG